MRGRKAEAELWAASCDRLVRAVPMAAFHAAHITLAKVLLAISTPDSLREARTLLAQILDLVETTHNTRFQIEVLALQALLHDAHDDEAQALICLEPAVTLAQPGGSIRLFVDLGSKMAGLLRRFLSRGLMREYIVHLLAAFPGPGSDDGRHAFRAELIEPLSAPGVAVLALLNEG